MINFDLADMYVQLKRVGFEPIDDGWQKWQLKYGDSDLTLTLDLGWWSWGLESNTVVQSGCLEEGVHDFFQLNSVFAKETAGKTVAAICATCCNVLDTFKARYPEYTQVCDALKPRLFYFALPYTEPRLADFVRSVLAKCGNTCLADAACKYMDDVHGQLVLVAD